MANHLFFFQMYSKKILPNSFIYYFGFFFYSKIPLRIPLAIPLIISVVLSLENRSVVHADSWSNFFGNPFSLLLEKLFGNFFVNCCKNFCKNFFSKSIEIISLIKFLQRLLSHLFKMFYRNCIGNSFENLFLDIDWVILFSNDISCCFGYRTILSNSLLDCFCNSFESETIPIRNFWIFQGIVLEIAKKGPRNSQKVTEGIPKEYAFRIVEGIF